eukprot:2027473-Karenia_brevis.AAC.1
MAEWCRIWRLQACSFDLWPSLQKGDFIPQLAAFLRMWPNKSPDGGRAPKMLPYSRDGNERLAQPLPGVWHG